MKANKLVGILALFCVAYIVQFLIAPQLLAIYFPRSNEATALFWIILIVIVFIGMFYLSDKMTYWFLSDVLYLFLIWIYSADGAYGIGMRGITLAGAQTSYDRSTLCFYIVFFAAFIILLEITIKFIKKILKN